MSGGMTASSVSLVAGVPASAPVAAAGGAAAATAIPDLARSGPRADDNDPRLFGRFDRGSAGGEHRQRCDADHAAQGSADAGRSTTIIS
ncbi:hypothetical protein QP175_15355 [Sphingomonas aerolata]|uniref:hypothetical protein n=1 Tax=Sphingomonas aerolata TaxID=185951 RepID=UPI002FE19133